MATLADYPDDWEEIFLSNPNFSMVDYSRKVDEYARLLKEKQDADDAFSMDSGAGSAGNVPWGGGKFSSTEYETGDLDIVADEDLPPGVTQDAQGNRYRVDDLGNKVSMGNRWGGLQINKNVIPNLVNMIPGYNVVKAINDSVNKNKQQTAATSTDTTGTTNTNVIPQFLSQLSAEDLNFNNMTGSMPNNISLLSPYNYGTSAVATPISAGNGGGLLDAVTIEAINRAYDESTGGSSGGWTVG
jgi:hypothetical protein